MKDIKSIRICKMGVYDPILENLDKFGSYDLITTKKYSPPVLSEPTILKFNQYLSDSYIDDLQGLFCSPQIRSIQTASLLTKIYNLNIKYDVIPEIDEITFSLKDLLSINEYTIKGSNLVRERFVNAFIQDTLIESRSEIKNRLDKFISHTRTLPIGKYLYFSHSFFMKLLQIYTFYPDLFDKPDIILNQFDYSKKTFDNVDGFNIL